MRRRRKALLALAGAVAGLALFELALQVVAFVVWSSSQRADASSTAPPERTILCAGDSYTWGLGALDPAASYPARLQRALEAETGETWSVINAGWPGQTSGEILHGLDGQLARYRPRWVYVLAGYNDFWGDASRTDVDPAGFPIVWRTGRLLRLVAHWLRAEPATVAPADGQSGGGELDFVGRWHAVADGTELLIEPDGRFVLGAAQHRWHVRDGVLYVVLPEGPVGTTWSRDGDRLLLHCGLWADPQWFAAGPAPAGYARLQDGWRALREGRIAAAVRVFEECAARPELAASAHEGLVVAHATRDPERAAEHVAALEAIYARDPARRPFESLLRALQAVGAHDRAFELACRHLETHLGVPSAWPVVIDAARDPARRARVREVLRRAVARSADAPIPERVRLLHALYGMDFVTAPEASLRWLLEACALDGSDGLLLRHIKGLSEQTTPEVFEAALMEADVTPAQRQRFREVYERAVDLPGNLDALEPNLRAIVARVRAAGAEPVLLDYPVERPHVAAIQRRVAEELGTGLVEVRAEFVELLRTRSAEELYARDGYHCSAEGYDIMAGLVCRDVLRRIGR